MNAALHVGDDTVDQIHPRAAEARAEIDRLEETARQADAELENARNKFAAQPTEKTALAKIVAEQKATNARCALERYSAEVTPILEESDRLKRRAELDDDILPQTSVAVLKPHLDHLEDALADARRNIVAACAALVEANEKRNELLESKRFRQLAKEFGEDMDPTLSIEQLLRNAIPSLIQKPYSTLPIVLFIGTPPSARTIKVTMRLTYGHDGKR